MDEYKLINAGRQILDSAGDAICTGKPEEYAKRMQLLLDLLIEELVGSPPAAQTAPTDKFNPEQILTNISIAIKHRTISTSERWYIVYYHTRLTCVPIDASIPPEIVLHEFTEGMVQQGFSLTYWNHLKQNVIKLYKELNK